jgi:CubicO group peptidase (beta-lactamase class C family)
VYPTAWYRKAAALPAILTTCLAIADARPQLPTGTSESFAAVDRYVEARLADHRVPGAALVIVQNGAEVHARAFGSARGSAAMTVDTPLVIGSLSKAFTATAVMQLVEEGRVELDAPVQRYLPQFRLADAQAASQITVRQLLHQTSGIPTSAARAEPRDGLTLADHVAALAKTTPVSPPGTAHVYASPNYQILGLLVERVSGKTYAGYLQERIFTPLGMTRTFTRVEAARAAGLADGHNLWFGMPVRSSYQHEPDRLPTASIITSARDLGRFASAQLGNGTPLLDAGSRRVMQTGVAEAEGFKYAMGWREGTTAGVASLWHGGALPSYRGAVVLIPERNLGIVLLTNSSTLFADHTREIAAGTVALLHGKPPVAHARPLRHTYMIIAAAATVLLILNVRSAFRAWRRRGRPPALWSIVFSGLVVPAALLLAVPRWMSISWRAMYESAPDITTTVGVLVILAIVTAIGNLRRRSAGETIRPRTRPTIRAHHES